MPTVHREHGFRFIVYTDDHPPPHVHVTGTGSAKIALSPEVAIVHARGLSNVDIRRVLNVVEEHRESMMAAWDRIHG